MKKSNFEKQNETPEQKISLISDYNYSMKFLKH